VRAHTKATLEFPCSPHFVEVSGQMLKQFPDVDLSVKKLFYRILNSDL